MERGKREGEGWGVVDNTALYVTQRCTRQFAVYHVANKQPTLILWHVYCKVIFNKGHVGLWA